MREIENPFELFSVWFDEIKDRADLGGTVMALSTVDEDGLPDCRFVLMKGFSTEGIRFFTNYNSVKARQLDESGFAALTFYWHEHYRQVRIRGNVRRLDEKASSEYFASRARDSQVSAWASPQSAAVSSREALEKRKARFETRFDGKDVECPYFWGGYILSPTAFEFWQGREARFHERRQFVNRDGTWCSSLLAP